METKRISLDREAYALLRKRKHKGETFSDAVKRIARESPRLSEFAGLWKKRLSEADLAAIEKAILRGRDADRERTRKTLAPRR